MKVNLVAMFLFCSLFSLSACQPEMWGIRNDPASVGMQVMGVLESHEASPVVTIGFNTKMVKLRMIWKSPHGLETSTSRKQKNLKQMVGNRLSRSWYSNLSSKAQVHGIHAGSSLNLRGNWEPVGSPYKPQTFSLWQDVGCMFKGKAGL